MAFFGGLCVPHSQKRMIRFAFEKLYFVYSFHERIQLLTLDSFWFVCSLFAVFGNFIFFFKFLFFIGEDKFVFASDLYSINVDRIYLRKLCSIKSSDHILKQHNDPNFKTKKKHTKKIKTSKEEEMKKSINKKRKNRIWKFEMKLSE